MGMNMVSKGTDRALRCLVKKFPRMQVSLVMKRPFTHLPMEAKGLLEISTLSESVGGGGLPKMFYLVASALEALPNQFSGFTGIAPLKLAHVF